MLYGANCQDNSFVCTWRTNRCFCSADCPRPSWHSKSIYSLDYKKFGCCVKGKTNKTTTATFVLVHLRSTVCALLSRNLQSTEYIHIAHIAIGRVSRKFPRSPYRLIIYSYNLKSYMEGKC